VYPPVLAGIPCTPRIGWDTRHDSEGYLNRIGKSNSGGFGRIPMRICRDTIDCNA